MRIQSVNAYLLSCPLETPFTMHYHGGERVVFKRDAMLIRIGSNNGVVGWGPGAASERWKTRIDSEIAPFLRDRVAADPDALRVKFMETAPDAELLRIYACLEIAIYDLIGKQKNLPVSEVIGGRMYDSIPLYASAGMYMPPEGYAAEAALAKSLGFTAYKMRPGMGPEQDVEAVRLMRSHTDADFQLMVDAHTWWRMGDRSYSFDTVRQLAADMATYDITWLEEPIPPDDHDAYRLLREEGLAPLATGEHEPNEEGFLDLLTGPCADYIQMDLICQGGYSVAQRIFSAIEGSKLRFAFHSWGTALEVVAAAQLGICWPRETVEWLEYPCYHTESQNFMYPFPLASEILTEPLRIEKGELFVPTGPGLGVTVNESVIDKYPWIPGPWSEFTLISPKQTFAVTSDHSVKWTGERVA